MELARFKNVSFLRKNLFFLNITTHNLGKEVQRNPATDMDVENAEKDSTSYPNDDGSSVK